MSQTDRQEIIAMTSSDARWFFIEYAPHSFHCVVCRFSLAICNLTLFSLPLSPRVTILMEVFPLSPAILFAADTHKPLLRRIV